MRRIISFVFVLFACYALAPVKTGPWVGFALFGIFGLWFAIWANKED